MSCAAVSLSFLSAVPTGGALFSENMKSSRRTRISRTTYSSMNIFMVTMAADVALRTRLGGPDSSPTSSTTFAQKHHWQAFDRWARSRPGPSDSATAARISQPPICRGRIKVSGCLCHRRPTGPVPPHPITEVAVLCLVAPSRHDIEPAVDGQEHLTATPIGRVGVVNRTVDGRAAFRCTKVRLVINRSASLRFPSPRRRWRADPGGPPRSARSAAANSWLPLWVPKRASQSRSGRSSHA